MNGKNNQNAYRRNMEMNQKNNNSSSGKNVQNKGSSFSNGNYHMKQSNSQTDQAVKKALERTKQNNMRHNTYSSINNIEPSAKTDLDNTLDTKKEFSSASSNEETSVDGKANVAKKIAGIKWITISIAAIVPIFVLIVFIVVIAKNIPSILFGQNNESAESEEWDFSDPEDKDNPYAEYQELYTKIQEEYEKVYDIYHIRIDKSLILATLTAPIGNEIFNDDKNDNDDNLDEWIHSGRKEYIMEAEIPLLARMQIMTVKAAGQSNSLCLEERDMQHFAMNDEKTGFWDNVLGFIFPWRFFRTEASKEKNYKCTTAIEQEFQGHETLVYVKSIEEGVYHISEIDHTNEYEVTIEPNTGGVYFWNLVNEGGFIQSYYQKYINTDMNDNEIDYEANKAKIYRIAQEIYEYYDYIKDKECGDQLVYDTKITEIVVQEEDGTQNSYDIDFYVAGVMAKEFNGVFNTGDSEAVGLGYFDGSKNEVNLEGAKAFAIIVRTYALAVMASKGYVLNSSANQNFDPGGGSELLRKAANETHGMVIMTNGKLVMTEYDAMCPITSYATSGYYQLPTGQRSIRISTEWGGTNRAEASGYLECPCGGTGKSYTSHRTMVDWDGGATIRSFVNDLGKVDGTGYNCWEGGRLGTNPRPPVHSTREYYNENTGQTETEDIYEYSYRPTGGHGRGASQYGIKYLSLTGYAMEEIIKAFYERGYVEGHAPNEEGVWTRSIEIGMMSNALGVEEGQCPNPVLDTLGETGSGTVNACGSDFYVGEEHNYTDIIQGVALEEPLEDALANNGYSISCLNSCISERVRTAGPGTRAGVVEAAFALIDCMYEMTGGYTLPYDHSGGKVGSGNPDINGKLGVNSKWGKLGGTCNTAVCRYGLNCANFVRWSFCNGGMDLCSRGSAGAFSMTSSTYYPGQTTIEFRGKSVSGSDPSIGTMSAYELARMAEPGDTITSERPDGSDDHAMVIVGKDDSAYYIAENGRKTRRISFSEITSGSHMYRLNLLDAYYAKESNKNSLY